MSERTPILFSACLAGLPCRYDGKSKPNEEVMALVAAGLAIPVCPEQLGGLSTPRSAAEIVGGDGHDVLAGKARVFNRDGIDVSQQFIRGAQAVGELARFGGVKVAILQERSPSCGTTQIYDGTFSGQLRSGQGVTGARLALLGLVVRPPREHK
ncbi:MAG TPA: DUF523 domain-containing protein [Firmicutes bacterium]|nr:DUF523 domain-containing protein [Bacillota bacterium]